MNYIKFFCDIDGTFTSNEKDRQYLIEEFVALLNEICEIKGKDAIVFSFITSDNIEYLKKYISELEKYISGSRIILGSQIACDKKIKNGHVFTIPSGKPIQLYEELKNDENVEVMYAEDNFMNHDLVNKMLKKYKPNIDLTQFILENTVNVSNGNKTLELEELNNLLKDYIKSLKIDNNIR